MGKRVGTGCETQAASCLTAVGCSEELLLCVQGELLWHCWVPWAGWLRAARCSQAPSDQQLGQLLPPQRVPAELLRGDLTSSAPRCLPVLGC